MSTTIEWTDVVWNPTTGCDRVSPGCDNCYALTMAKRLKGMGSAKYQRDGDPATSGPGFGLMMHSGALREPLRWRKPRRVFVNSMSDLFHKDVTDEFIAQVFVTMAMTHQHAYQILTKRHARLRTLLNSTEFQDLVRGGLMDLGAYCDRWEPFWPLPNVWLGVSVESQKWANIRVPALMDTPAAIRFLSCEPLLGPLDLAQFPLPDWVIVGGESGPNARPISPDWVRDLRDQCVNGSIGPSGAAAFFFKQWGGIRPKSNGRELDGRTWDEMPAGGIQ